MEKRLKPFNISMKKERKCKTKIHNKINYQILIIFFIFSYSIGIKSSPFGICYDSIISIIIQKNNLKNQQNIINQDYIPFIKEIIRVSSLTACSMQQRADSKPLYFVEIIIVIIRWS